MVKGADVFKPKSLFLWVVLFSLAAETASAYIDPGTGGAIVGSVWPLIAALLSGAAALVVKHLWNPLKSYAARLAHNNGKQWKQRLKIALVTGLVVGLVIGIVDCVARIVALNFEWFELYQNLLLAMIVFTTGFIFLGLVMEACLFFLKRQFDAGNALSFHVAMAMFLLSLFYGEILAHYYFLPPDIVGDAVTARGRAVVLLLSLLLLAFLLLRRAGVLSHITSVLKKQKTKAILKNVIFVAIIFIISSLVIDFYLINTFPLGNVGMGGSPNVILITLDTVRADHLSVYNYSRNTTPNLDRFAESSVVFDNAFSPSSWTLPSHATYFTGKYSENHGATLRHPKLENEQTTLAEILHAEGYITAGFTVAGPLKSEFGMGQGFQTYRERSDFRDPLDFGDRADIFDGYPQFRRFSIAASLGNLFPLFDKMLSGDGEEGSEDVNRQVFSWLGRATGRPFFLFINYFDAHEPYTLGKEFRSRFTNDSRSDNEINELQKRIKGGGLLSNRSEGIDVALLEYAIVSYDSELFYLDRNLGELFDKLDEMGLADDTIIIIESDHGEEFYEHRGFRHGETLYEEVIHVPLIIYYPQLFEPRRISQRVEAFDLFPTVLDILGIDPPDDLDAVSLIPLLKGEQEFDRDTTFATLFTGDVNNEASMQSITYANWKLIEVSPELEGVPSSLFNLEDDPGEQKNLYLENEDQKNELRKVLANLTRYPLWSQSEGGCAQFNQSFLRDVCYLDPTMAVWEHPPPEFSCGGSSKKTECTDDSTLRCRLIENPYLAYTCFRVFFTRTHMKEFATTGYIGSDAFIPEVVGVCDAFGGHHKLFCTYLYAASIAKSDLSEATSICSAFEDESFVGECNYYIATALAMGLAEDMSGTVSSLMDLCENVSFPPWRSECYYVLADELTLLPESNLKDIAIACRESSAAHDYWCNNHVVFEMPPERMKEFCNIVDEGYKANCILGLGEALTPRFIDNLSLVVQTCNEIPLNFRKYCFEGMGRRLFESNKDAAWRIEQCNKSPVEFVGDCLNTLGEKLGYFAANVTVGLQECEFLPQDNREQCLHELSWRVSEKVSYDVPLALEECESFPAELKVTCLQDLSSAIGRGFYHDIPAGIEKCGQFPVEYKDECLQVLSQTLGERLSPTPELGLKQCDELQAELRESCIQGLLCGFEPCDLDAQ